MSRLLFARDIASRSEKGKFYLVRYKEDDYGNRFWECSCLPFLFKKKNPCFHILEAQRLYGKK